VVVHHAVPGRTGYHLYLNSVWYRRFQREALQGELGILVRTKRTGSHEGYPSKPVIRAVWRHFVDRFKRDDPEVSYSRRSPVRH
jgi:hypothetical protein